MIVYLCYNNTQGTEFKTKKNKKMRGLTYKLDEQKLPMTIQLPVNQAKVSIDFEEYEDRLFLVFDDESYLEYEVTKTEIIEELGMKVEDGIVEFEGQEWDYRQEDMIDKTYYVELEDYDLDLVQLTDFAISVGLVTEFKMMQPVMESLNKNYKKAI